MYFHHQSRRSFIRAAGLLSAICIIDNAFAFQGKTKKIGLQMYTMRHVINKNNAADIIEKIAVIGYKELEIFGYNSSDKFWGYDPKAFKKLLKQNGLKAPAAHIPLTDFILKNDRNSLRNVCDAAATVGNEYVILAWLDEQYRSTEEDYKKIASKLNEAALIAREYDLTMAYHNHDFEFTALENNKTGYSILLEDTDPQLVKMELDLYWCVKAGIDPFMLFREFPGRFPLWHVKDMDGNTKDFTEVGTGIINFRELFLQAESAGLQHFFIEQDKISGDVWQSIEKSYRNLCDQL